jgi:hypothetical protein
MPLSPIATDMALALTACCLHLSSAAPASDLGSGAISQLSDADDDDEEEIHNILWKWRLFLIASLVACLGFIVLLIWICLRHRVAGAKVSNVKWLS